MPTGAWVPTPPPLAPLAAGRGPAQQGSKGLGRGGEAAGSSFPSLSPSVYTVNGERGKSRPREPLSPRACFLGSGKGTWGRRGADEGCPWSGPSRKGLARKEGPTCSQYGPQQQKGPDLSSLLGPLCKLRPPPAMDGEPPAATLSHPRLAFLAFLGPRARRWDRVWV